MPVVGVWSARPKVSILLVALVGSLVPLTANVLALNWMRRLPEIVSG